MKTAELAGVLGLVEGGVVEQGWTLGNAVRRREPPTAGGRAGEEEDEDMDGTRRKTSQGEGRRVAHSSKARLVTAYFRPYKI